MQILLVIDSIKKATVYGNELHTSEVILTFSIYLFYFIAGPKNFIACARNFRQNSYSFHYYRLVTAFCFYERDRII